jgi:hypothetical protein
MRVLIIAKLDNDAGNELISSGQIGPKLEQLLNDLKPEAAYFLPHGRRAMHLVVNLEDPSQLVTFLEPLWLLTKAEVDVVPVMVQQDLQRGMQAMPELVRKYRG